MAKKTKRQMLIEAMEWLGFDEVASSSRKYVCYQMSGDVNKFFLGKNGALRKGVNVTTSISLTHRVDSIILRHQNRKGE